MPIHVTTSTTQSLSNKTFVDYLSTTGVVYASGGNSNQWNSSLQTLSFNESNAQLSISSGNTVSLSALSGGGGSGTFVVEDANTIIGLSVYL